MVVAEKVEEKLIEIYLSDLSEESQEELTKLLGEDNYQIVPLFILCVNKEE